MRRLNRRLKFSTLDLGRGRQVEFADGELRAHPAVVVLIMPMIPTVVVMMMMTPTKVMPVMTMMSRRRPVLGFVPREDVVGPRRRQAILRLLLPRDAVLLPLLVLFPRPRILPPRRVVRAAGLVAEPAPQQIALSILPAGRLSRKMTALGRLAQR